MITPRIHQRVNEIVEDAYYAGSSGEVTDDAISKGHDAIIALIREEAIMLADSLIGRDRLLHGTPTGALDPVDKAVYDFQVQQRIKLAEYQKG